MTPSDPFSEFNDGDQTVVRPSPGGRRHPSASLQILRADGMGPIEDTMHDFVPGGDNPLVGGASALLSLVPKLRNTASYGAVDVLRERLVTDIRAYEQHALKRGVPRNQLDIAKYFLCSLLDETVLNTPWGSQSGWGHNSLSSLFYRKLAGGEEFFQILGRLCEDPGQNRDLLELAYYCLSMGFEGKYRYINNGLITLERQRQELYLALQRIKGDPKPALSIHWQGVHTGRNPLTRHVPFWVLVGLGGVILMVIYMILTISMGDRSDQLYETLVKMGRNVENTLPPQLAQPVEVQKPPASFIERLRQLLADDIAQHQVAIVDGPILRVFDMFPSGGAEVRKEYQAMLSKFAQACRAENVRLTVVGNTDSRRLKFASRFKSNWHLSLARAESTADALHQYGIARDMMRCEAMADKDPIAPNDTAQNRALNRRIDIHIR